MKASKLTYLLAIAVALTFVAGGCKKKPAGVTELPGRGPGRVGDGGLPPGTPFNSNPNAGADSTTVGTPLTDIGPLENYNQDRTQFENNRVQFDYDSAAIKGSERPKVDTVASFMKGAAANVALLVEGHCDERGTEEYNRALGERRALAVREALISAGADGAKIVTRSFGKDRKLDTSESESGHAKNRRAEFVVLTPK